MFTALASVSGLLALALVASALLKLSREPAVVQSYARAGVPARWLRPLAFLLLSAAAGLALGLFWLPLGVATASGLIAYFAVALAFHLRARDFSHIGMPALLELLAVVALWLRLNTP